MRATTPALSVSPQLSGATMDDLLKSADLLVSPHAGSLDDVRAWLRRRSTIDAPAIERIPLDALDGWHFAAGSGDLVHDSGGFFQIRGLRVRDVDDHAVNWSQPIVYQPEIGVLGILTMKIDGVLCLLMQAKMEPGNINTMQLSPTVQATRSNYRRVHGGAATRYLGRFTDPDGGRLLVDVLQSEQGGTFYQKRNRNMIVEVRDARDTVDEYRWLTLGQVYALLREDNVVNMNARSVLSNLLPVMLQRAERPSRTGLAEAVAESLADARSSLELRNWFNGIKARCSRYSELIPLGDLAPWRRTAMEISHPEGRYFSVIGVSVNGSNREVPRWQQPLVAPSGQGVVAFVVSTVNGVLEVLLQARAEAGTRDAVELAPTVQAIARSYDGFEPWRRPPLLDLVLTAPPAQIRYDVLLSEEGGRFFQAVHRYMVVEVGRDVRDWALPPQYRWASIAELAELVPHSGYFTVESRSLLACMQTLW
ncbi:NDP-hexose 2,3-dehydratase family protein [Dactylosporangium fulvum]|uniref:NDP-hexose 2,3-dehydratase family protein n=1 Tax=Dactylosporangium fulvum TaxID=53359 RepID=A0ABY5W9B4_9ACTN|nr:NDP-hexose 2,3-dehydratase family protein [Dactylosporangium fulvum]UWP86079.1 NDP-hexose 2,3-dehydratase family protein [Dactylosporangium fulvum]